MSELPAGVYVGRVFPALYEGVCRSCREDISIGDMIKRAGPWYFHEHCEIGE